LIQQRALGCLPVGSAPVLCCYGYVCAALLHSHFPAFLSCCPLTSPRNPLSPPGAVPGMAPGVPNGMHSGLGAQHGGDANMAALMESLHSWQLNGGGHGNGGGMQHNGGGPMHPHRASMEGMTGVAGAQVSPAQHSSAFTIASR
jgi:hypothetical protein